MSRIKEKKDLLIQKYEEREALYNSIFFIGGVLFDIFTLDDIDSLYSIGQQTVYLSLIGLFLYFDLIHRYVELKIFKGFKTIWLYRDLIIHFLLGGLLSVYSIFFIKSASFVSSFGFIMFMLILLIGNELKVVQKQQVSLKVAIYFICIFSFFSMIFPVILGHLGKGPFILSLFSTSLCIYVFYKLIKKRIENESALRKALILPSSAILTTFLAFYFLGWIPPVPLSIKEIGVYHKIERTQNTYNLYHEHSPWKFWLAGDQNFKASPDDRVYIFLRIFSPAQFRETLFLNWQKYLKNKGWSSTDRIPIRVSGGRKKGFRGVSYKENYSEGDWRVLVETRDGREVGRINFDIEKVEESQSPETYHLTQR